MNILQLRGGFVETVHPVRAVAIRMDEHQPQLLWQTGTPTASPWRSAAKPLQLYASLLALAEGDQTDTFSDEELAMGAASHSAQVFHLALVHRLLNRFGLQPDALLCGAHPPMHEPTAHSMIRAGEAITALHNNCSGKHAFMLGACEANGWPLDYRPPDHPLQRRILDTIAQWTAESPGVAVDGCGVPTFYVSVMGMATAWARIARSMQRPTTDPVMRRIGRAMSEHPRLTSGDDRLDLAVAQLARERFIGKIGAGGLFNMALPERRLGIAIKVLTGDTDALGAAIPAVLDAAAPGAITPPDHTWPWHTLTNVVGRVVGRRVAVGGDGV